MRNVILIVSIALVFSCNTENGFDCFQTVGDIIQKEFEASDFQKITVNKDVELILKEGPEYQIIIETGENLMSDIEVVMSGNRLTITDNNGCNLVRDYISTKAYVTAPNINEIRNSSQYTVSSQEVLTFPKLHLISEDFIVEQEFTVGDFRLDINNQKVSVTSNNITSFYLTGQTDSLNVGFFAGTGKLESQNLTAAHVNVFHRGSNDMVVNPQQSLTGELRGAGNLISINQPPLVAIEQFYTGELIFED